jgi:hypothetical protein
MESVIEGARMERRAGVADDAPAAGATVRKLPGRAS